MSESNFAKLRRRCSGGGVEERRGSQAEAELVVQALLLFGVSVFFSGSRFCTASDKENLTFEPSQSRSPQKLGSGGCKLHVWPVTMLMRHSPLGCIRNGERYAVCGLGGPGSHGQHGLAAVTTAGSGAVMLRRTEPSRRAQRDDLPLWVTWRTAADH